jgi:hypothetical protein
MHVLSCLIILPCPALSFFVLFLIYFIFNIFDTLHYNMMIEIYILSHYNRSSHPSRRGSNVAEAATMDGRQKPASGQQKPANMHSMRCEIRVWLGLYFTPPSTAYPPGAGTRAS